MKKLIVNLDLHDDKAKMKAMKKVSSFTGIDYISMDMKERKMTVVGDIDPVKVVSKLRKGWRTDILQVETAKEPEKNKNKNTKDPNEQIRELERYIYKAPNPYMTMYYNVHSAEEDPNACAIL